VPILLEEPTTTETPRRRRRTGLRLFIGLALFAFVVAVGLYLDSDAFRNQIRLKVVHELELMTGGRVELSSLEWKLSRLQIDISNITIHGLEGPNEAPYFHADHLLVQAKILSIMQKEIGLRYVRVEHPVVHIIAYPDGSTNQPRPKIEGEGKGNAEPQLFDLRLNRLEIANGLLIWNDRDLPMNLAGDNVSAAMRYVPRNNMYDARLHIARLNLSYKGSANLLSQADLQINLYAKSAELKSLHWTTSKSKLELSGRIPDFMKPRLEGSYRATIDLAEAGQLAQIKSLRGGLLDADGTLNIASNNEYSSSGKLHIKDATWTGDSTRLSGVDAAGNFTVDPDRVSISRLVAHLLGGSISGEGQIIHWTSPVQSGRQAPQGSVHLSISNVDLGRAKAAAGSDFKVLSQMKIVSEVSGKTDLRWSGSPSNLEAEFAVELNAPNDVPPPQVPMHGTVNGSYSGVAQRVDVRQLNLATRWTRLDAVGTLGATSNPNAALRVNVNTTDISEFQPIMRASGYPAAFPVELHGRASFSGVVNGKLSLPTLSGHLQLTDFDTTTSLAAGSTLIPTPVPMRASNAAAKTISAQEERVHWDSLVGDISYSANSASVRNMLLKHGRASITGNATAGLVKGALGDASPITIQLKIVDADVMDLQSIVGVHYPLTGMINAQGSITGHRNDLRGGGDLRARGGQFYGQPYRTLQGHLNVQGQELQLMNLIFDLNGAVVDGGAEYNVQNKEFGFDLRGNNFNLAQFAKLLTNRIAVAGTAQFTVNGSGTVDQPSLNANLLMRGVQLNGQPAGDITLTAVTRGTDLHLTGRSSLQNSALALDGDISLRGDFPGSIKINVAALDLNPLLSNFAANRYPLHTSINGIVAVSGSFKQPRTLSALAELPQLTATMETVSLHNAGPVRLAVREQIVNIEQFHIVGTDTDLTATGTLDLAGAQSMRIRANGHLNLKLLQSFDPSIVSYGFADFVVNGSGTIQRPDLSGQINVRNAGIAIVDAPNGLSEMNGTLIFEQDRVRVQKLTATTGGGTLDLGGFITYKSGLYFDLSARGRDVRLRYPEGTSSQGDADLRYVGNNKNALLSGDVLITRFGMSPRFDVALWLTKAKQPPAPPNPDSVIDNIRLDIHVTSTPELRVETSLAKLAGDIDLHVKGTVARPSILGRVNIAEGDIFFNNTKYHLERGDVLFANPVKLEPVFNMEASTHVREYDITLGFHGTPDKLSTNYRSDPPLPSADILQLLAFGQTPDESQRLTTPQSSETITSASNAILGSALNAVVGNRVQKLFGISKVKIDPTANAAENPNAQLLTIEQQISNRVTITYRTNVTQAGQQVISVEYNINPNVSLLAVRDQYGVFGLDVRIRQRKR
jgi:translocation and assembly module TamB